MHPTITFSMHLPLSKIFLSKGSCKVLMDSSLIHAAQTGTSTVAGYWYDHSTHQSKDKQNSNPSVIV